MNYVAEEMASAIAKNSKHINETLIVISGMQKNIDRLLSVVESLRKRIDELEKK